MVVVGVVVVVVVGVAVEVAVVVGVEVEVAVAVAVVVVVVVGVAVEVAVAVAVEVVEVEVEVAVRVIEKPRRGGDIVDIYDRIDALEARIKALEDQTANKNHEMLPIEFKSQVETWNRDVAPLTAGRLESSWRPARPLGDERRFSFPEASSMRDDFAEGGKEE